MASTTTLMTAEEYLRLPPSDRPTELVRGQVVEMNVPYSRHGQVCAQIVYLVKQHVEQHQLGHVLSNDSGVITERNPDTVRGADVSFYSFARAPKGPLPAGYLGVSPELVFEVRSPSDRWAEVIAKAAEYLAAGVTFVCIVDPPTESCHVYSNDQPPRVLTADNDFSLPDVLGDFCVPIARFFE